MNIVTWNIQVALGIDGRIDASRIAETVKELGENDIICLQEVTRESSFSPTRGREYSGLADELASHFPEYEMFYGSAVDRPAVDGSESQGRYYFGNMILAKVPVQFLFSHKLPQPSDPTTRAMPREALEILVEFNGEPLRIITTHLEYFAIDQRKAQLNYLMRYQEECCERFEKPSPSGTGSYIAPPETDRTIMCGDFNMEVNSEHYNFFTKSGFTKSGSTEPGLTESGGIADAWNVVHGSIPHSPTCGIFDHEQWPNGEHCRDFFFISPPLEAHTTGLIVNTETQASDHQPVRLCLE